MRTDQKLFLLKCIFVIFLVLLWIIGTAVFGVLLWLRLDFWTNEFLEVDGTSRYLILVYIFIVTGGILFIAGFFGLFGAACSYKWALVTVLIALCLTIILSVGGIIYAFIYREELADTLEKGKVTGFIQKKYKGVQHDRVTYVVDLMQSELKCCGGDHWTDYDRSAWQMSDQSRTDRAPFSCCSDYERLQNSQKILTTTCPYFDLSDPSSGLEKDVNPNINKKGCGKALKDFFYNYVGVIAGISVAACVLQIINLGLVSGLIHTLNHLYVPQAEDVVYDMAHKQEKSPYPSRGDYSGYYR